MIQRVDFTKVELIIFDFDGVFTDNTVVIDQNGIESVTCWRSDGLGLSRIKELGIKIYIISTETNPIVSARAKKLQIPCVQSVENKSTEVIQICNALNVSICNTMFVGNDINDIPAFKIVGLPIAVADAYPEVLKYVVFRTLKSGGKGAVREICDRVYYSKTHQLLENEL